MKTKHKLSLYLILTFGISWPLAIFYTLAGGDTDPFSAGYFTMAMAFMFTPMLSVIVIEKAVFKNSLKNIYPLRFKWNKWWLIAWLSPLVIAMATFGVGLLVPGVHFTLEMEGMFDKFQNILTHEQMEQMRNTPMPVHPFFLTILQGLIAGISINAVAGFGEELGWRGLMLKELSHLGFWKLSWVTGLVWGAWHAPIIMMGHNYPDHPIAGVAMMILFCLLFSPFFTLVAVKSRSVIGAAVLHGSFNALGATSVMLLKGGNDLLIGTTGFAGIAVLTILNIIIWRNLSSATLNRDLQTHCFPNHEGKG
jgi:membrane protease YdiL (CAAX protease family)